MSSPVDIVKSANTSYKTKFPKNIPFLKRLDAASWLRTGWEVDFPVFADKQFAYAAGSRGTPWAKEIQMRLFWNEAENKMSGAILFNNKVEGPPGFVHGGCLATVVDNVMGFTTMRVLGFGCVTLNLNLNYRQSVPLDSIVRVEIKVEKVEGRKVYLSGGLYDAISIRDPSLFEEENSAGTAVSSPVVHVEATALFYKADTSAPGFKEAYSMFGGVKGIAMRKKLLEQMEAERRKKKQAEFSKSNSAEQAIAQSIQGNTNQSSPRTTPMSRL